MSTGTALLIALVVGAGMFAIYETFIRPRAREIMTSKAVNYVADNGPILIPIVGVSAAIFLKLIGKL